MADDGLVYKTREEQELARRIFANDFLMFCAYFFRVMTGEVMKINWHHKFLCKLIEEVIHKRVSNVLVNISPGAGKCSCAGEKVFTERGFIPIEDVVVGDVVYSFDCGNLMKQKVIALDQFEKECTEVKTKLGVKMKVSSDHPILTHKGWKHAEDLIPKYDFLMQLCTPIDGTEEIPDAELDLATLLLFEGGTSQLYSRFTSADFEVISVFKDAYKKLNIPIVMNREKISDNCITYHYALNKGTSDMITYIRKKYGFDNCLAIHKRLPIQFFNMPLRQKYRFIGLMIATDGYICSSDGTMGIALGSEELAKDIKLFLMTCGVPTQYRSYKNGFAGSHSVTISSKDAIDLLDKIDCLQKNVRASICKDTFRYNLAYGYPTEFITKDISHRINTHNNLVHKHRKVGQRFHLRKKHPMCTVPFFERLADELAPELKQYFMKDFIYDYVTEVKSIGIHKVYHIQVEAEEYDKQNYILNGIVTHNSVLVSRLFPLYCYALNPHSRFLLTSCSDSLVEGHSVAVKDVINSPEFQSLYPGFSFKSDSNKKSEWILQKDGNNIGEFCAFSIGGGLTGRRAGYMETDAFNGCIIIDDPIKPADALSKAFREDCNNKLTNTIYSRRALITTPIFMIMQRLHTDDPTGSLLSNSKLKWTHINIPAIMTPSDVEKLPAFIREEAYKYMGASFEKYGEASYWEYKKPLEALHALKEEDPDTFMAQYMQEPSPEGGVLIQKSWFPQYKELPTELTNFRITADTAVSAKQTADNSVFLLTAENKQHDLFVLDLVKGKWEMPQLVQNALNFVARFKNNFPNALFKGFYIEYKQSGQGLIQTLRQNTRLPLIDVTPKGDKVLRVQQCLPYMQSHRIHVPENASWVAEFMDELARFTPSMKHKHDDQVDALVYAIFDAYIDCRVARVSNYYY